ncbi:MAG: hypothetical protein JWO95_2122 [Verrucomicrobiales bacterium]|nr:hypothetical protein [Verrucomicrobiales bacterium]
MASESVWHPGVHFIETGEMRYEDFNFAPIRIANQYH